MTNVTSAFRLLAVAIQQFHLRSTETPKPQPSVNTPAKLYHFSQIMLLVTLAGDSMKAQFLKPSLFAPC